MVLQMVVCKGWGGFSSAVGFMLSAVLHGGKCTAWSSAEINQATVVGCELCATSDVYLLVLFL